MRAAAVALSVLAVVCTSAAARAAEPDEIVLEEAPAPPPSPPAGVAVANVPPEEETEVRWYGWQTLASDGASILTAPIVVGIPLFFVGTPLVHAWHGNLAAAGISFAVRGSAAAVILAGATRSSGGDMAGLALMPYLAVSAVIGSAAIAIDAAALAYETKPVAPRWIRVTPSASLPAGGGLVVGFDAAM